MADAGLDVMTRHRYLRHLTEVEGVSREEGAAFLDVLSAGLRDGAPEGTGMRDALEARMALARDFTVAVESVARASVEAERAEAARSALERIAGAGPGASQASLKAFAERSLAALPRSAG